MSFVQTTFLGASIRNFSATIGWGSSPSKVSVRLVEDPKNGDVFAPPEMGTPLLFNYGGWEFGGILKNWEQTGGSDGSPLYNVVLEDPRSAIEGVQLILNNYNGTVFGMPNLFNVYGYIENTTGFGSANVTNAGIPWQNVRDAVIQLAAGANKRFGDNIFLGTGSYEIDLSELPVLPEFYRIPAQNMSLMSYIQDVCDAANHEFYFTLFFTDVFTTNTLPPVFIKTVNTIKLNTINRNIKPEFGAITDFVTNNAGAIQKNAGFEFRNEVTSKFVSGGNVIQMFDQGVTTSGVEAIENTIWPYWGEYANGNVVLGEGVGNNHTILLDATWVEPWPFETYPTDVGEMRAAIGGQSSWEAYLWLHNYNIYKENADGFRGASYRDPEVPLGKQLCVKYKIGTSTKVGTDGRKVDAGLLAGQFYRPRDIDVAQPKDSVAHDKRSYDSSTGDPTLDCSRYNLKFVKVADVIELNSWYKHNSDLNAHFGKASTLGIGSSSKGDLAVFLSGHTTTAGLASVIPNALAAFDKAGREGNAASKDKKAGHLQVFEFVKAYAEEFYGKKFMVKIPFVLGAKDSDTGEIQLSREPADAGFVEESLFVNGISNNLIPPDINKFTLEDGRLISYVKFHNQEELDFGDISAEDITINPDTDSAFIKVNVDPSIKFIDRDLLFSPRVVITLPGIVRSKEKDTNDYAGVLRDFLTNKHRARITTNLSPVDRLGLSTSRADSFFNVFSSDNLKYDNEALALLPHNADVALKSNITTYGPWFASGVYGKLEYEQDDSLVPWNYGGFTALNNSANARVSSSISNYLISEAGSVEFPGVPVISMGSQLELAGPYITDVNVQIDFSRGATTTYTMRTWTPQPYKLRKEEAAARSQAALVNQRTRRQLRDFSKLLGAKSGKVGFARGSGRGGGKQDKSSSTHTMIVGEMVSGQIDVQVLGSGGIPISGVPLHNNYNTVVGIQPHYDLSNQLKGDNYENKGGISLDGIFQPYSIESGNNNLPFFETIATGVAQPNINDLNPFLYNSNYGAVIGGSGARDITNANTVSGVFTDPRSLAFRSPAIFSGWGYDDAGNPIPSGTGRGGFPDDINKRPDLWKTGPLDMRWNDTKKIWVAGGVAGLTCDSQNAIIDILVFGNPTGGTFLINLSVDGTIFANVTFNYDDTAAEVKTALEGHSGIGVGDVVVTAGPFPTTAIRIEFTGDLSNTAISAPIASWSLLTGGAGKAVLAVVSQLGIE